MKFGQSAILRSNRGPFFSPGEESGNNADGGGNAGGQIVFKDQADLDRVIQRRLERDREAQKTAVKDEVKQELLTEQQNAENQEQGKFKEMYEAEVKKVEKLENDIKDLKADAASRELDDLKKTIATKYKLPVEIASRLQGTTEEELTTDAKALAKTLKVKEEESSEEEETGQGGPNSHKPKPMESRRPPVRKAADNDVGKGNSNGSTSQNEQRPNTGTSKSNSSFAFVKEGDVSWG